MPQGRKYAPKMAVERTLQLECLELRLTGKNSADNLKMIRLHQGFRPNVLARASEYMCRAECYVLRSNLFQKAGQRRPTHSTSNTSSAQRFQIPFDSIFVRFGTQAHPLNVLYKQALL